jgi:hypothetical protein
MRIPKATSETTVAVSIVRDSSAIHDHTVQERLTVHMSDKMISAGVGTNVLVGSKPGY